jgi:hypothetical protein
MPDENQNPLMVSGVDFPDIPKLRKQLTANIHTKTPLPLMHLSYVSPILSAVGAIILGRRTLMRAIALRTYLYNTAPMDFKINIDSMEDPALVREILEDIGSSTDDISFLGIMDIINKHREYAHRLYNMRTVEDIDKDIEAIVGGTGMPPNSSYDYLLHEVMRAIWSPSKGGDVTLDKDARHMQYLMASHDVVNNVGLVTDDIIETYDIYRNVTEQVHDITLPKTELLMDLMVTSPTAAMELINTSNAIETKHGSQIEGRSFWGVHNNGTVRSYTADNELLFLERARINPAGPEMGSIVNMTGSPQEAGKWLVKRVDEIKAITGSRLDFNKLVHQQVSQLKGYSGWISSIYNGTFLSLNDVLGTTWEVDIRGAFDI